MFRYTTKTRGAALAAPLLVAGCGPGAGAGELVSLVDTALAGSQVTANADVLLGEIGARISALPSGERAQEFVRERLAEYGLENVRLEPFPLLAWARRDASLEIVGRDDAPELRVLSLGHVGSYDLEAPLVDAGYGTAEEIAALGEAVRGRIVLADVGSPEGYGRSVHRTEKVTLATRAGAAGFIQANASEGPLIPVGVASLGDEATRIPAAAVDRASAERLRSALAEAEGLVAVRLRLDNWMERAEAANVLADLPGSTDEVVLVGAHLDSWDLSEGALDNASGTLAVLDAARALAEHAARTGQQPLRTIRFAFWMGEELGLYGSRHHVARRVATGELDRYVAVLNMDVVGPPTGLGAMGRPEAVAALMPVIERVAAAGIELDRELGTGGYLYSDHQPFLLQGVAIVSVDGAAHPDAWSLIHTTADTRDKIDETGIGRSAAVAAALLWSLANDPEPGLERWSEPEIGRKLEEMGLRDPLERGGEWRW